MKRLLLPALLGALAVAALNAAGPPAAPLKQAEAAAVSVDDTQDVLYLGQPHPVLLRLHLRVGNQSAFARWDKFMETFFQFLDRNKSGFLDRSEGNRAPTAVQMNAYYSGNPFSLNARRPIMVNSVFNDMDADRDGKVTLEEFKGFYLKNQAGPVVLQANQAGMGGAPVGQPRSIGNDPLFELLDTNKDGKLSKAELEAAFKTLVKYDTNDDEMVSQAELNLGVAGTAFQRLAAAESALAAQMRPRQPPRPQATNLMLVPREEGKRMTEKLVVAREIIKRFDKDNDGKLTAAELGLSKEKFSDITRKRDGKATALDLAKWLAHKPAAEFTVRVGAGGAAMMRRPAKGQPRPNADDQSVALEGVRIKVVSSAGASRFSYRQYITNLFKQIDEEAKGFITRRQLDDDQYAFMRGIFDFADRNLDNRLTEVELKALLAVMDAGQGAQLTVALAPSGQGLFQVMDSNADGNLSVRELRNAWKLLASLDKNNNGAIDRGEFPQQFLLSVRQGPNTGGFVPPDAFTDGGSSTRSAGPVWFRKMDRNGDGDVSRLEWLGSKEDFDRADTDKDDLISLEEAEAFDAKLRKKP